MAPTERFIACTTSGCTPASDPHASSRGLKDAFQPCQGAAQCQYRHPLLDIRSPLSEYDADIVSVVPAALDCVARCKSQTIDATPSSSGRASCFHVLRQPGIGVQDYCHRIAKYSRCSPVCFAFALIFIQRLAEKDPVFQPSPFNLHRLLITGVLLAAKLLDDSYYNNAYFARIGGVSTPDLNLMELEMLKLLGYRLYAPETEVGTFLSGLRTFQKTGKLVGPLHALNDLPPPCCAPNAANGVKAVAAAAAAPPLAPHREQQPHLLDPVISVV